MILVLQQTSFICFQDRQLEGCVRDFIAAGSGDLRILLNWDFLCLLSYPKYYEEIMREINSVMGNKQNVISLLQYNE